MAQTLWSATDQPPVGLQKRSMSISESVFLLAPPLTMELLTWAKLSCFDLTHAIVSITLWYHLHSQSSALPYVLCTSSSFASLLSASLYVSLFLDQHFYSKDQKQHTFSAKLNSAEISNTVKNWHKDTSVWWSQKIGTSYMSAIQNHCQSPGTHCSALSSVHTTTPRLPASSQRSAQYCPKWIHAIHLSIKIMDHALFFSCVCKLSALRRIWSPRHKQNTSYLYTCSAMNQTQDSDSSGTTTTYFCLQSIT